MVRRTVADLPSTDPNRDAKRQGWLNVNVFSAKLSTYGVPELDERSRAANVLRDTLERTPWEVHHHPDIEEEEENMEEDEYEEYRRNELELRDVRTLNATVPAAAAWIKINGKGIYEMDGPMETEYDWDKTNWTGKKGWSKERFHYWRERFEWISKVTALDKATRGEAKTAAELMKQIEEGN
jgi:hypothetical protein